MSFLAELKNIFLYPKENDVLSFAIVEQRSKMIKVIFKGTAQEVCSMICHRGPIRFYAPAEPQTASYKGQQIPVYNVTSFITVSKSDTAQPVIQLQKPDFEVEFSDI